MKMAKGFTVDVQGLDTVLKKFDRIDKFVGKTLDLELDVAADNVAADAKANAPRGRQGRIVSSIAVSRYKFRKEIGVGARFAAFVEFGTGTGVFKGSYTFTPAEKAYARTFYVSGKGRMRSRAYLFPALRREIPKLRERIKNRIKDSF